MKSLRKLVVVSVMSFTVLSMSMVVAPNAGAVAQAGDLIKMDGLSSVYYLGADGKRYVFPNETTYFSWYSDFSSVVTIPQSELESYPLGANVTMRPGTNLVKITTDPKVYAVEPGGNLLWVPDEATAMALYGDNWASRVVDVPDAFFTNYTISSDQVSADAYPAGSLVKFGTDATVYYINASGNAQAISDEAAFTANRFNWDNVIDSSLTMPTAGSAITGAESGIIDTSEGAGGTAGAGTGLTVSLAGDTPASQNVPSNSTLVPFVTVKLTASADGAVTVQNMVFTRTGTGATGDLNGGYLFVGDTRLTNKSSVNSSDNTLTFNAINLSIPAGMTKQVTLKMDINSSKTGNHAFKLASASAVTTNGAVVSGSFPITGNLMSLAAVNAATVTFTGVTGSVNKKIGETGVTLGEFTINNDSQEVVEVHSIALKNDGTAGDNAVNNLSLDLDGTIVASGVSISGKMATFMLDTPFSLDKGKTITATIRGDVISDIDKTVKLYLKNDGDADVRGTAYGDFYSATLVKTAFTAGDVEVVTIKGSEIDVSFDGPAASDVKDDTKDVVLANFKVKSNNLGVNIEDLEFTLASGGAVNQPMTNLELVDSANNLAYSVTDPASSTSVTLDFENVNLVAGVQYNFQLRGDIQDNTNAGTTYSVSAAFTTTTFNANFTDADETAVAPSSDLSQTSLTGKTMTVKAPTITMAKVQTNDSTVVKGAAGVLLYKGKLTATNVDDLKVSKIGIAGTIGDNGGNFSQDWSKLYLYKMNSDSTETMLDSETSLDVTSASFTGFTLTVPKGLSNGVYIVVRGDVKSSPTGTTTDINLPATSASFTVRDSDNNTVAAVGDGVNGHTTTVATVGTFTMAFDQSEAGVNSDQNVLAGGIRKLGRLKVTATKEGATIDDLVIQNSVANATNVTLGRLYLYADKDMTELLGSADLASGGEPKALFQDVNINIPKTGVTYIYVGGLVKGIDYSDSPAPDSTAVANKTINLRIPADDSSSGYVTKVVGVDTGDTMTNTGGAVDYNATTATSTVMGATISGMTSEFANGTLANGTAKDIFSFKVTAPSSTDTAYDGTALGVILGSVTFNVATTSCDVATLKIYRDSGANGEKTPSVTWGAGTATFDFSAVYGSTDEDRIIRPGDTATYILRGNITNGGTSGDSLQVTIENIDTNVSYKHTTTDATTYSTAVNPLISGVTYVRGGTLSN